MFRNGLAAAALLAVASPAFAQTAAVPVDPAMQRRYHIKVMEGVLVGAVRHGADMLGSRLRPVNPNLVLLTGMARARGFVLEGYGVFFDVEVPMLRESVAWSIRTMALGPDPGVLQALAEMKREVAGLRDPGARATLQQVITRMEQQIGGPALAAAAPDPSAPRRVSRPVADEGQEAARVAPMVAVPPAPPPADDPNALYTETVKNALIDAMLDHSGPMAIRPDEWLTVAAKDAEGPLGPGEPYDAATIILRIKGSDLAAYRADRLTREQARAKVEVREF